jgi:hypothetical protein
MLFERLALMARRGGAGADVFSFVDELRAAGISDR